MLCLRKIPAPSVDETCRRLKEMINREYQFLIEIDNEDFDQGFYEYLKMCDSFQHIEYWSLHNFSFTPEEMARKVCAILVERKNI